MRLRHWASALPGLGALILAIAGFLHHQQRLDALDLHQRDDRPTQAIRSELAELRSTQAQVRSELDALNQQLSRLGEEHAQLNTRLTSQQVQLTGLRDAPEDPRLHTLNQRIEQLESRTATPYKPAVTVRKPKPSLRPAPSRALPALPALPELLGICDRIYTLSAGRITGEVPRAEATQESLMTLMTKEEQEVAP